MPSRVNGRERERAAKLTAAAGAALGGTVLFAPAADAATFNVTNLDNDGTGSLRDAIEQANANDGDDVITFQAGLSGTIELADDGSGTGEDIEIYEESLDIQGPGADVITVDGNGLDRIFTAYDFDYDGEELRIAGLTLTGGDAAAGHSAGALYNSDGGDFAADLTVADTVLTGNEANGGGAIWSQEGSVTITGSTISDNVATDWYAGGLYARADDGSVTIRDTTFSGNTAVPDGMFDGGGAAAIWGTQGDVVIERSTFSQNETGGSGGGIRFDDNLGNISIVDSTFSGNHATDGGGIYLFGLDTDAVAIERSTFEANEADDRGGGMIVWGTGGPVTVSDSTVSGNIADADDDDSGYAGGIAFYSSEDAARTIRNSTVTGNRAFEAGGIYNHRMDNPGGGEDNTTISSTIVAGNVAEDGGDDLGENEDADGSFIVGFSLIGDTGTATITEQPAGSNLFGVDPRLGPLQNNGGPTLTHAPAFDSPVVDAGTDNDLATDQRGAPRRFDASNVPNRGASDGTDIGAVELLPGGRLALERCKARTETVLFAPGAEIIGSDENDVVVGTAAADSVRAERGKDLVCVNEGDDSVRGGGGNDRIFGLQGVDRVRGNAGRDKVKGGGGKDRVNGGAGGDGLVGQGGRDKLTGKGGSDRLKGGGGKDTLKGGGGKDRLRGGPGKDRLRGGAGKDSEKQ